MVKVAQMDLPAGYQELLNKITSWYDNQIYPTWATRFRHTTRSAKAANKAKTYIPGAQSVWATYDASTKALWKSAGTFMQLNGYLYFVSKYSYCRKNALSLTLTPNSVHQMYGLLMSNIDGIFDVEAVYQDIALTGPLTVAFKYKKDQYAPPYDLPFRVHADLYYFEGGENKVEVLDWSAPNGSIDWTAVSQSFGTAGRYYFHLVLTFLADYYDVDVFLDNLLITDQSGETYREAWRVKPDRVWNYTPFYRKRGWEFYPDFAQPFFDVLYLE